MRPAAPGGAGHNAFVFILITIALDMMGFGLIMPVLPDVLEELTGKGPEDAVALGGYLSATFAVMNFFTAPILGGLSDRFGRRPILLASIGTLAIDFMILALAQNVAILFLGRALSGMSAATVATANAYIADVTEPKERGRAFGMLGAAFGFGFVLGPALGGLLGELSPRAPFFAAAGLAAINFLYGALVLPESLGQDRRRAFEWKRANPLGTFIHFRKLPAVSFFLVTVGLLSVAHLVYPSTWNFFGAIRYGWSSTEIGISLALVGIGAALVQGGLLGRILTALGPMRTAALGLGTNVVALTCYALAVRPWMAYAVIPLSALGGVATPALNAIMSARTPANAQGELHGATASLQSLAAVVSPLLMTQTLHAFTREAAPVHFAGAAFALAAAVTILAFLPFVAGARRPEERL